MLFTKNPHTKSADWRQPLLEREIFTRSDKPITRECGCEVKTTQQALHCNFSLNHLSCVFQNCCIYSCCQVVLRWRVLCNSWKGMIKMKKQQVNSNGVCVMLLALVCSRMTVFLKCGIPPLAGALLWWSRTPLIKRLSLFTSPLFIWPIPDQLLVCPGGRPASICPSKKQHGINAVVLCQQDYY